jgi:hypothetical protein
MQQALFGGALECRFPEGPWRDVSDLRPVPDNQEVFTLQNTSIVIEIVERADVIDADVAAYYWQDLSEQVGAAGSPGTIVDRGPVVLAPRCSVAFAGIVSGTHAQERITTRVSLGVVRLPQFEADILFTQTSPLEDVSALDAVAIVSTLLETFCVLDPSIFNTE